MINSKQNGVDQWDFSKRIRFTMHVYDWICPPVSHLVGTLQVTVDPGGGASEFIYSKINYKSTTLKRKA